MKKIIVSMLTVLCVFLVAPAGYSDVGDLITEGKELMQFSQQLMDKGQMLQAYKDQDKAWMVDQGHQMLKAGMDMIEKVVGMFSSLGRTHTQEVGGAMRAAGNLLLKMGRKKDPLTDKDKEKIVKHGETMIGLGKLKLEQGKMMAP